MPKQRLKAWLPTPEKLHQNRIVRCFAPFLADARLWHMNRNSLGRAVYIGVLCAFFPLPGQMPLAIIGALLFRANVPMAIALTWLTNPLTTIPIFWVLFYLVSHWLVFERLVFLYQNWPNGYREMVTMLIFWHNFHYLRLGLDLWFLQLLPVLLQEFYFGLFGNIIFWLIGVSVMVITLTPQNLATKKIVKVMMIFRFNIIF